MDEKKVQEMLEKTVETVNEKFLAEMEEKMDTKLSEQAKALFMEMKRASSDGEKDMFGITNESKKSFFEGLKALHDGNINQLKAINISTDEEGGYGLATDLFDGIIRIAGTYGVIAALATKYSMTTKGLEFIRNSQGALLGTFVGELEGTDEESITFKSVLIEKKTWQIIFGVSRDHLRYSAFDAVNVALILIAEGLSARLEKEALIGGSYAGSPFVGVLENNDVPSYVLATGSTSFSDLDLETAGQVTASIAKSVKGGSAWLFHPTVWAKIKYEKDTAGNYVVAQRDAQLIKMNNDVSIMSAGSYEGYPVFTSEFLPALSVSAISTAYGVFGNIARGLGFALDQKNAEIETSDVATVGSTNAFTQRARFYRANADLAIGVIEPNALTKVVTAAS